MNVTTVKVMRGRLEAWATDHGPMVDKAYDLNDEARGEWLEERCDAIELVIDHLDALIDVCESRPQE